MTLLQELMQDLEYLQAKIDYAIKEHPDYTEYLVDAKERLEEADSILYGIDGLEVIMLENSNIDMKGLSYDESHIQSIYSNQLCIAHKSELDVVCSWLEAALNCKGFHWEPDQENAARESVKYLKFIIGNEHE